MAIGINEVTRGLEAAIQVSTNGRDREKEEEEEEEERIERKEKKKKEEEGGTENVDEKKEDFMVHGHDECSIANKSFINSDYGNDNKNNNHITGYIDKSSPIKLKSSKDFQQMNVESESSRNQSIFILFVDRSSPWQLHRHLIQMSAIGNCPAVALDNLSDRIAPLLSLRRLCAFGFRKRCMNVNEPLSEEDKNLQGSLQVLLEKVVSLCPAIELPWRQCEEYLMRIKRGEGGNGEEDGGVEAEDECETAENVVGNVDSDGNDDGEDDCGDKDKDIEMEDSTGDLSYNDLYIVKGVNEEDYRELLQLRKTSAFMHKDFKRMMFNYNPHQASFCPPSFDMASVFYTKKQDQRAQRKSDGVKDGASDATMADRLEAFLPVAAGVVGEEKKGKKRKRRFTDDVVKKVLKNEFKKKRK